MIIEARQIPDRAHQVQIHHHQDLHHKAAHRTRDHRIHLQVQLQDHQHHRALLLHPEVLEVALVAVLQEVLQAAPLGVGHHEVDHRRVVQ